MNSHHAAVRPVDLPEPLGEDATPMDVAKCIVLSVCTRRRLLEQWSGDESAQLRAQNEGMTAKPETSEDLNAESAGTLQEIAAALAALPGDEPPSS